MTEQPTLRDQLPSRWRPLLALFREIDGQIAVAHAELGVTGVRPRFTMALMFLESDGPMTIRRLSTECGVTHSAMSQSVTEMRKAGLVRSVPGDDARSRLVSLTKRGRDVVPVLRAEWDATEAAIAELEDELPYKPSQLAVDLAAALACKGFTRRLLDHVELPNAGR